MAVDTVEKVLYYLLKEDVDVKALVGTRIYPVNIPQAASMPAIVYEQTAGPREHTMAGPIGMVAAGFNINCWAETYGGADALADKVRILLDGYDSTVGTVYVYVMFLENETDLLEQLPDARVTRRYGKQLTFTVWHKEATS